MCFATAAAVSGLAGLAGAGIKAAGTVEGGAATASSPSYAAQVAANNAAIANNNANYAEEAGQAKATATSLKGANAVGRIKSAQAASGIDVNSGSAVDVRVSEREGNKVDALTEINNANLQAYGYRTQAMGYQAQSALDTAEAKQAPIGADLSAAGGILASVSSLGLKFGASPSPNGPSLGWSPFGAGGFSPT